MQFRQAQEHEAQVLSEIAFKSKSHWSYSPAQLAAWREDLTISPATISALPAYVVEIGTEILGFFVLAPGPKHWRLEHFWVLPAVMGRGIGRALLAHAIDIAAQGGAAALEIDADPNAEHFYVACGAGKVGSVTAPIEGLPDRERPQMLVSIERPNFSIERKVKRRGLSPAPHVRRWAARTAPHLRLEGGRYVHP